MSCLYLPNLGLISRCIRKAIQLHDLCTFSGDGIIAESLPLEADFSECIFDVRISLHLPRLVRYVVQLDSDMSDKDCTPNVFCHLLNGFLELAYIQSANVADESPELTLRCVVHIENGDALRFLGIRDRQFDKVTLVALGLLRDQVLIVIEREGLPRFNLRFHVGLHVGPEIRFVSIEGLKNKFIEGQLFTRECVLICIIQLFGDISAQALAIRRRG